MTQDPAAPPRDDAERRRKPRGLGATVLPVALGAGLLLLFFGALLRPALVLAVRDVPMFHLPLRLVWSTLARDGWPLWNPLIHGGQPILSNPNYAAFYPPTWLALVVAPHYAIGLIVVLHAAWAFAGAWALARRLGCRAAARAFAAVAFVGGGAFVAAPANLTLYCGLAWLPWVLCWGDLALHGSDRRERGRGILLAGAALAAQIVSGEPYSPTLGALALLCLALSGGARWHRRLGRLATIGVLSAVLGAVQLIPTLRHLADSPRSGALADEQTMTWSAPPDRLVEWVFPNFRGDVTRRDRGLFFGQHRHDRGSPYVPSIYVGQLVLIIAAAALLRPGIPHRATWAALIVLGVALALGRYNPLYAEVLVHVPPWSLLRFPEKFILLSTTGLAFAAALGWERLLASRERGDSRAFTLPVIVGAAILAAAGGFLVLPFVRPDLARSLVEGGETLRDDAQLFHRLSYLGLEAAVTFALAIGSLAILWLHRARRVREALLAGIVLAFVLTDLYRTGHRWLVTARAADVFERPAAVAELPEPAGRLWTDRLFFGDSPVQEFDAVGASSIPLRFVPGREQLQPYWANLWGIPYALNEDFDLMLTAPARHALDLLRTRTNLEQAWTDLPMVYMGAWNVCNVLRRRAPDALLEEFRRTGARPDRVRVLDNPFCLDRYRLVSGAEIHADLDAATTAAQRHGFDVASHEFLVGEVEGGAPVTRSYADDGQVWSTVEQGARVDLTYAASRDALLVAAVTFDRKWRADVDGARLPVLPTAIGQMAVEVPAGTHRLTLRYRDPWIPAGLAVSLAGIAGCLAFARLNLRRSPAHAALRSLRA